VSRCIAVGTDASENGKTAVVNTANAAATPWSGKLAEHILDAVACAKATTCVAVASDVTASVAVATGAARVVATMRAPADEITALDSIACPSAAGCYAVGFQGTEAVSKGIVAHVSAGGALLGSMLEPAASGYGAIACPTATECLLAEANRANPERIQLLTNGHFGVSHALPAKTYVEGLACFKALACLALGGKTTTDKTNELLKINPTTGALESVSRIAGAFSGNSIACSSATECIVTGFSGPSKPQIAITMKGKPSAPRAVGGTGVGGIACTPKSVCFAVGQATNTEAIVLRV
jgi:hypothetical protein